MSRLFFLLFLCLLISANVFSDEKRDKFIFLPFGNNSDKNLYPNSGIFGDIFSKSLYSSIKDYPNKYSLTYLLVKGDGISSENVKAICDKESAKFAVYGNYYFEGEKSNPKIIVDLYVYDAESGSDVFNKKYQTTSGQTVFKDIDKMISEVMKNTMVDYPENAITAQETKTNITKNIIPDIQPAITSNTVASPEFSRFHVSLLTLDFAILSGLLEYYPIDNRFWVGGGAGFSIFVSSNITYVFVSPIIETGYYLLGDMQKDFRMGGGCLVRLNIAVSSSGGSSVPSPSPLLFNIGAFIRADYKIFTLQPEIYMDFSRNGSPNFSFTLAAGVHL